MRHVPSATALSLLLMLGAACTPAAPGANTEVGPTRPSVPQKIVVASSNFVPTLHPYISIGNTQRRFDIYDTILSQNADGSVGPAIATSWKTVDPTTWEMKIRQDMVFHNGSKMVIEDLKFSIDRAIDPEKKYAIAGRLTTFSEAIIVDPTTLRVKTKTPDPLFPKRIMLIPALPKAYLESVGDDVFANKPIGTGPFRVVEWKEASHVQTTAMPEHPYRKAILTDVTVRQIPEASARLAGLRTGDIDYAEAIPFDQGKTFESQGFKIIVNDSGSSAGMSMDTVVNGSPTSLPTRDKKVRQAINYAVDKEAIAKNIYLGYTKVEQCQLIQPETFGFNPKLKPYPYDPAMAKRLLAEAGYPNGFKLEMRGQRSFSESEPVALFVQSQLKEVGVEVDYQIIEGAVYRDMFYGEKTRPGLFVHGLTNRPAFDADFAFTWFAGTNQGGIHHYDNTEFDKNYLASQQEMNETKRLELLQNAAAAFCENPPYLFLVQNSSITVYKNTIQGIEKRTDGWPDFSKVTRS